MIGYQVASQLRAGVNSSSSLSALTSTGNSKSLSAANSQASSSVSSSGSHLDHDADDDRTPSPSPSPTPSPQSTTSATTTTPTTLSMSQPFGVHCNKMIKRELEAQSTNNSNINNNNNNIDNQNSSLVSHQSYAAHQMALHRTSLANIEKLAAVAAAASASNGHTNHHDHNHNHHLHNHLQQQHHLNQHHQHQIQNNSHLLPAARSPGHHSAASSPCSSVDSPVSSSSTSSGVGSTNSLSTRGNGNSQQHQHQQIATLMNQHQQLNHHTAMGTNGASNKSPLLLLDHFPQTNGDGLRLTWFHEANSRSRLSAALMSDEMMVAGDISLAEMSRYPVPIMARPPLGVSDLTLENWLHELTQTQPRRGIKLTFTSTRTVEPAFRVLARHAEALKGPLILCADILTRCAPSGAKGSASSRGNASKQTQQQQQQHQVQPATSGNQPVDAWTFLMMCRTRFPKCTISIGWCPPAKCESPVDADSQVQQQQQQQRLQHTQQPVSTSSTTTMNGLTLPSGHNHQMSEGSIFDLDLIDAHPALSQLINAGQLGVTAHATHVGHLQHLTHQQHRPHHILHPYPLAGGQLRQHQLHMRANRAPNRKSHHHIASSAGSLSGGSSGNSSGSPSPTSPTQLIMTSANSSPSAYQTSATNLSLATSGSRLDSTTERLLLSACSRNNPEDPSAAAAAAAAVTAALVAASNLQQMPLNLNINEAADRKEQTFSSVDSLAGRLFCEQQVRNMTDHAHRYPVSPLARQSTNTNLSTTDVPQQLLLRQADSPPKPKDSLSLQASRQSHSPSTGGYTRDMVDRMAALVKEYNLSQPVTFPVAAVGVLRDESLAELQRLLYQVGASSSLTIVAQPDDLISVDDLLLIRRSFGVGQLLFDLPDQLAAALRRECDL